MPICQGRATGPGHVQPCPDKRNDSTVRGRQGDLLLCDACTEFRFPTVTTVVTRAGSGFKSSSAAAPSGASADATSRSGKAKKATKQSTTQSIGGGGDTSCSVNYPPLGVVTTAPYDGPATATSTSASTSCASRTTAAQLCPVCSLYLWKSTSTAMGNDKTRGNVSEYLSECNTQ